MNAQAGLRLCFAHTKKSGYIVLRLKSEKTNYWPSQSPPPLTPSSSSTTSSCFGCGSVVVNSSHCFVGIWFLLCCTGLVSFLVLQSSRFGRKSWLLYSKTYVKRSPSKRTKIGFKDRLMQVKSIAECSKRSILQYFDLH